MTLLVLSSTRLWASPQQSELMIVGNDTLRIYQILLSDDMADILNRYIFDSPDPPEGFLVTTGNWRGYRGVWELADDTLYLLGFQSGSGILGAERVFPDKVKDGKVVADWYDSTLIIPKGEVLRWDGVFRRTYVDEEHLTFRHGRVASRRTIHNYIDLPNGIDRLTQDFYIPNIKIAEALFNCIVSVKTDWIALEDRSDDVLMGEYIVTIGANGKVVSVTDDTGHHSAITRLFKRRLRGLQFDIIKFNGKPYKERICVPIDLDEDKNQLVFENH